MLFAAAMVLLPVGAGADTFTTQVNVNATVNGDAFTINGPATYSSGFPSDVTNDFTYSALAINFPIKIVITIINTWKCTVKADPAANLAQASNGAFNMDRTITVRNGPEIVGSFQVLGTVATTGPNTGVANLTMTGTYTGPTDVTGASGYKQTLRQFSPNRIDGEYTQTFTRDGGPDLIAHITNRWTYAAGPGIPADEYSVLYVDSLTFDSATKKLNLTGRGFYELIPTCPSDLNSDGVVDDNDFVIFAGAYDTLVCSDPTMSLGCPADFNNDSLVDDIDFTIFVPAYNDLVCP
jgi:hypothetical protein